MAGCRYREWDLHMRRRYFLKRAKRRAPCLCGGRHHGNFQFPILKNSEVVEPRVLIRQVPPKATLIVDLAKDEGTLLQEMHEKTRYNIRLAERQGVRANTMSVQEGFDAFWTLMQETARRDRIGLHAQDYYRKMLEDRK